MRVGPWTLLGVLSLLSVACGPSMYSLPPPPPQEEWAPLDAAVEESEEEKVRRFLDAKAAAIQVFALLQARSFADVLPLMSQETQAFFEDASNGAGAVAALETGELVVDGKTTPFDPVADLLIDDLRDLRDDFAGQSEAETPRRKELYAIAGDGRARKLVFIFEADAWRFHSPFVKTPILSP